MDVYPLFLKLRDRPVLLVGSGAPAARKAALLLRAGARLRLAADALTPPLAEAAAAGKLSRIALPLRPEHFVGLSLVVVATADETLMRQASALAQAAGVPVNVVDRPELSSAISGAVIDRDPVIVAVSTGGASPTLARELRRAIERMLPERLGRLAAFARRFRAAAAAAIPEPGARRRFWERWLQGPLAKALLAGEDTGAQAAMMALVNRAGTATAEAGGMVYLVGAGPGDPELLTLRAHRLLHEADAIVHDRLVDPRILDYARRDAERHDVGKAKGRPSFGQEAINALLVALAREGKRVVRLKGGDPFIFGRGGEELEALRRARVPVEVVPGISAALGCAAAAQIPLTHRAHASAVTFVTAHAKDGAEAVDWAAIARLPGTIAVYMGASEVATLARALTRHGLDPATPAAIIENGTREGERVLAGRLGTLPALAAEAQLAGPSLILIGAVAALAKAEPAAALALAANG